MDYFSGMASVNYAAKMAAMSYIQNSRKNDPAAAQFERMFYSELLKQVFSSQSSFLEDDKSTGSYFPSSGYSSVNDLFAQTMADKLISAKGLDQWQ